MHRIRLRAPWELVPLEQLDDGPRLTPQARVEVPGDLADAVGASFRGRVRLSRRFNAPTNLDPDEHVWLVFEALAPQAVVVLNGTELPRTEQSPERHDIRPHLDLHNQLELQLPLPAAPLGEVRLEIG